ncbi:MsnO8 family LLM class oxidoreductase [Kitasatospora sp. NBC_01250]|uniref:MsnO8 family LLM class oxidoreductase n=1 Tax=unclassified Kitasatospora TaxID=2633591 RepID=UPI002E12637E|nr:MULTISPECIES: MsnO8 family LLM class oxidoreductase [unclassified Kitasatospora]WSJ70295.1 MsnO8 family LLM class oxidoreductase [Kitasatospora sp. NBC_01302]
MTLRLSVLDQTPVGEHSSGDLALRSSVELARALDPLGFTRYWTAEHHGSPGFAGTAPEILATALLGATERMRIGTGGVLLPRYPALKVAEVFGVLSALYPGRVDLGIGRAGGPAHQFPRQLAELRDHLGLVEPFEPTVPRGVLPPRLWLLGAGTGSAELAGEAGSDFAFAHFLNPRTGRAAFETYRHGLAARPAEVAALAGPALTRPAAGTARPTAALAVRVVTADTAARAELLAQAMLLWRSRKDLGHDLPLPSAHTTRHHRWTGAETERALANSAALVSGTPEQVHRQLTALAAEHQVDELIVNTLTADPADRLRSYELLAEVFALDGAPAPTPDAGPVLRAC